MNSYEKKLFGILVFVIVLGTIFFGSEFLSPTTLIVLSSQLPEYGLITIALMITLIISGMNLSIVSMVTLSGITGALMMEQFISLGWLSTILGIVVMIVMGAVTGALNGAVISYLNVSPILTTLGTMLFYRGIALNITKGGAITSFDKSFILIGSGSFMGVPIPFVLFVFALFIVYYILSKHEFGSQLYRIGQNQEAAVYSGINVKKTIMQAYVLAGIIAGITAVIMTARYNSIRVDYGSTYLINAIVIVSLGGVDFRGGKKNLAGVILALLIVSVIIRILELAYIDSNLIEGIMGLILLMNIIIQMKSEKTHFI